MAIFQDWAKKTGDWEEVASEAPDFYFLNDVKVMLCRTISARFLIPEKCVIYCYSMH